MEGAVEDAEMTRCEIKPTDVHKTTTLAFRKKVPAFKNSINNIKDKRAEPTERTEGGPDDHSYNLRRASCMGAPVRKPATEAVKRDVQPSTSGTHGPGAYMLRQVVVVCVCARARVCVRVCVWCMCVCVAVVAVVVCVPCLATPWRWQ